MSILLKLNPDIVSVSFLLLFIILTGVENYKDFLYNFYLYALNKTAQKT